MYVVGLCCHNWLQLGLVKDKANSCGKLYFHLFLPLFMYNWFSCVTTIWFCLIVYRGFIYLKIVISAKGEMIMVVSLLLKQLILDYRSMNLSHEFKYFFFPNNYFEILSFLYQLWKQDHWWDTSQVCASVGKQSVHPKHLY